MMQEQDGRCPSDPGYSATPEPVPVSALRASTPSAGEQCTMGVGCDQYGVCYAEAHGRPDHCPHHGRDLETNAWAWLDATFTDYTRGRHANDRDYSADEMVDAFMAGHAQAIEARSGETRTRLDPKDESAVGNADAPDPHRETHDGR